MTEKELIFKIRELRQIKPREDWVSLTKSQILGQEPVAEIRFLHFPFLHFPLFVPTGRERRGGFRSQNTFLSLAQSQMA